MAHAKVNDRSSSSAVRTTDGASDGGEDGGRLLAITITISKSVDRQSSSRSPITIVTRSALRAPIINGSRKQIAPRFFINHGASYPIHPIRELAGRNPREIAISRELARSREIRKVANDGSPNIHFRPPIFGRLRPHSKRSSCGQNGQKHGRSVNLLPFGSQLNRLLTIL